MTYSCSEYNMFLLHLLYLLHLAHLLHFPHTSHTPLTPPTPLLHLPHTLSYTSHTPPTPLLHLPHTSHTPLTPPTPPLHLQITTRPDTKLFSDMIFGSTPMAFRGSHDTRKIHTLTLVDRGRYRQSPHSHHTVTTLHTTLVILHVIRSQRSLAYNGHRDIRAVRPSYTTTTTDVLRVSVRYTSDLVMVVVNS